MTGFGKRKETQSRAAAAAGKRHGGEAWVVIAIAAVAFMAAFALVSVKLGWRPGAAARPAAPRDATAAGSATGSPLEFLKGRWVTRLATCSATDNYAEFRDDGYVAYLHGRRWADIASHVLYWRKGSILFVKEDGNKSNPILSLKLIDNDHIAFLNLTFEGEEGYDQGGPPVTEQPQRPGRVSEFTNLDAQLDALKRETTVEEEWRDAFRLYLATLKRCATAEATALVVISVPGDRLPIRDEAAAQFLQGRWVNRNATCAATDNFAVFSQDSLDIKVHGQVFGRGLDGYISYSRTGDAISIGIGRKKIISHIDFRVRATDDIEFADFNMEADRILHPEKEWAFTGNSISSNDALVTNEWRQLFSAHLQRLKRCGPRKA